MSDYRRLFVAGGMYFFTVVTARREPWLGMEAGRSALGRAMRATRGDRPFTVTAIVVLPDHLHTIWRLPDGDRDFSMRWKSIKQRCTNYLRQAGFVQKSFWQPRFWEHLICDEDDLERHVDYIHYNPVKHELCDSPHNWPASSFHQYVSQGLYAADWGGPQEVFDAGE